MMRISAMLLAAGLLIGCNAEKVKKEEGKEFNAYGPAEYLWERWAYPYEEFDVAYYDEVMNDVRMAMANKDQQNEVSWRLEGPTNIGGRINVIVLHPDDEEDIWMGTAAGGIFRSENGGDDWTTVGDDYFAKMSIGSIAFDPQDSEIIYVGTGDPNISGYAKNGDGIYKSTDGGVSWTHLNISEIGIVSKILINQNNGSIYAASMGNPYTTTNDRGVYKSTDGGDTWENVLFLSNQAGISSMVAHPTNQDTIYAAGWDRIRSNTQTITSGDAARIYRTYDGGETWETLLNGLEDIPLVRAAIDISISNPAVLYASFVDPNSYQFYGVYKSEDYGDSWTETNIDNLDGALGGFGWYFGMIRINPADEDNVSVAGVELHSTTNGGDSWFQSTPNWWLYEVHADMHELIYNSNGDIYLGTDGGIYKSTDNMDSWEFQAYIPITQIYRIAVDPNSDEVYAGGAQDNGTFEGNHESVDTWPRLYGGDGFQPLYNPDNSGIFYATTQNGNFNKYQFGGWNGFTDGIDDNERVAWDAPLIMSSHDYDILYTGTTKVYRNVDGDWTAISEDLNASEDFIPANRHVITMVAESPIDEDVLYAGTSDGKVWTTANGGGEWTDISEGLPNRYVTDIKASSLVEGRVYVTHSGYKDDDDMPHIHVSDDYGQTWTGIDGNLPDFGINHVEVHANYGDSVLFIASDGGVYYTTNSGDNWDRVGDNMPIILVFDIEIDYDANRLVAGTFARSIQSVSLDSLLDFTSSIKEYAEVSYDIYPNPAQALLNVNYPQKLAGAHWEIVSIDGKRVKQGRLNTSSIEVGDLNKGSYLFIVDVDGKREVRTLVKE